jgi:hypothetical protein
MIKNNERADQRENEKNLMLKKKIEDAIRNSLDPLSAQRALEGLHPLFLDLSGADRRQRLPHKRLNHRDCQQQLLSNHSHGKDFAQKKCDNRVTLPSIETILDDYRKDPSKDLSSNYVPRCSVSEPIPVLEMFDQKSSNLMAPIDHSAIKNQRQRECQSQNRNDLAHQSCQRHSSYDADAAMSLLRLERTTRTDFSTFWDWKKKKLNVYPDGLKKIACEQADNNASTCLSRTVDCSLKEIEKVEKESKLGKVKRMQQAYRPPVQYDSTELFSSTAIPQLHSSASSISRSSEHEPLLSDSYSATFVQYDGDENVSVHNFRHSESHLTDSEIISVSKYFSVSDDNHEKFLQNDLPADPPNTRNQSVVDGIMNSGDRMRVPPNSNTGDGNYSEGTLSTRESYDMRVLDTSVSESQGRHQTENVSKCSLTQLPPTVPHSAISPMNKSPQTSSSKEYLRISLHPINLSRGSSKENFSFCDFPSANTETPTSNDYSLGGLGLDSLLDWTRNLDIDVV